MNSGECYHLNIINVQQNEFSNIQVGPNKQELIKHEKLKDRKDQRIKDHRYRRS